MDEVFEAIARQSTAVAIGERLGDRMGGCNRL